MSSCAAVTSRSHRLVCKATASVAPHTPHHQRRPSVLKKMASVVELQDQVRRFEEVSGRSAMIGIAAAVGIELVTEQGVFHSMSAETAAVYGTGAAAVLLLATGLAYARTLVQSTAENDVGASLVEAVYASLTAVRRSASSITQAQVDKQVDKLVDELEGFRILGVLMDDEMW